MSKLPNSNIPVIQLNLQPVNDRYNHDDDDLGLANDPTLSVPALFGVPLKYISLVTLAIQNSALTLIMHYSRVSIPPSQAYSAATAVLLNEILKGLISLVVAFTRVEVQTPSSSPEQQQTGNWILRLKRVVKEVLSPDCWKLSIPAILYVIQNNLQYVAASNLEAATFQVSYQMKILTTAGFSVLMLRKKLSSVQWFALFCLAVGVAIVQIQAGVAKDGASQMNRIDVHSMNGMKGFMAVSAACFTSGLAGVYFEMVLKNNQTDLWIRNVQLSLFSLLPALAPIVFSRTVSGEANQGNWFDSFFHNFGVWAWATVAIQVLGGLVTAMVIKYSDNILKGFATSLSIVMSFMASVALFDFRITFTFTLGSLVVLVATWLYNQHPKRASLLPSSDVLNLQDKWRGNAASLRSPPPGPAPAFSVLTSSRTSSTLSLSSLGASTKSENGEQPKFL